MAKKRVLFVCIRNSARSQMAEAFLNALGSEFFEARSAGFEPGKMNPLVVEAMSERSFEGSHEEKLARVRVVRDQIKAKVEEFVEGRSF